VRGRSSASASAPHAATIASGAVVPCSPSRCAREHPDERGKPFACRPSDGACVPIASVDCTPAFDEGDAGDARIDDVVWIGSMFPLTGPNAASMGRMHASGVELARKEIAGATRVLAGADAATHVPRIGLVSCDDAADPMRAAKHLVEDVGVPAIVGFGSGNMLVDVAGAELIPHRVVAVSSITQNPLITRIPQPADLPRMVWSTTYDAHQVAHAAATIIDGALLASARSTTRVRVAIAHSGNQGALWFADELYRSLTGDARAAGRPAGAYDELSLPTKEKLHDVASGVAQSRPTVVVLVGDAEQTVSFADEVERSLAADATRPIYLLDVCSLASFAPFFARRPDRLHRVFGICSPSNEIATERFVVRYNAEHTEKVSPAFNPANSYDAFYAATYAVFAMGGSTPTGPTIARGLAKLTPPGRHVDAGPLAIFDGISALSSRSSIDLDGASGALDFDVATGEAPSDFVLVCPHVDARGRLDGEVDAPLRYRAKTGNIEGRPVCP
jgi:branched-chain amino acid transport system substrate-binding protein